MWLDSKSMQAAFARLTWLKLGLMALVLLFLLASAFGAWLTFTMPEETEEPVTLVNYEHQGDFDYLVYIEPGHLFGAPPPEIVAVERDEEEEKPLYFTNIIDDIEVGFTYGFAPDYPAENVSSDVDIVAIIHGPSGWQKEIPIDSSTGEDDYFTIRFPLELDEFNEIINDIEEELEIRTVYEDEEEDVYQNIYQLDIEATVNVTANTGVEWIEDTFVQSMEINVGIGTLEWDDELNLVQRRYQHGFSYKHVGNFGYTIWLDEETILYGTKAEALSPEPYEPPVIISRSPGEVHFPRIVDIMKTSFSYRFDCDRPVTNLVEEVKVTATLEHPAINIPPEYTEVWKKTFTLVPMTEKSGDFRLDFPVEVNYFSRLVDAIRDEIGMGAPTYDLIIEATVHTTADTQFGPIDEVFTHTLKGDLGTTIIVWHEELQKSESGTIESTRIIIDPYVGTYRILSLIVLALLLIGFIFVTWNAVRAKLAMSWIEEEAFRAKKKYKNVIVDVRELPVAKPEEAVIAIGSLDELIKAADALLKPVLHLALANWHTYCVIDGLTRYEYTSQLEPPDEDNLDSG